MYGDTPRAKSEPCSNAPPDRVLKKPKIVCEPTASSVELTNGTRALVIKENPKNLLRPMLLGFDDNNIYDLSSDRIYSVVQIRDILKTMDKRVKLSENFIEQFHTEQS